MGVIFYAIGFAVFFGAIYLGWSQEARLWRDLAVAYRARQLPPVRAQLPRQSVVLFGGGHQYQSHAGIVAVEVTASGLGLRLLPVFSWLHPPLHIPFSEISVQQTDWYLNSASFDLVAGRAPRVRTVITGELLDWISQHAPEWGADVRRRW